MGWQDKNEVGLAARAAALCRAPSRAPPSCIAIAMRPCSRSSLYGCAKKEHKLNSRWLEGKVYPHEIDIQETQPKHRKLDSQAALSHRARGRGKGPFSSVWDTIGTLPLFYIEIVTLFRPVYCCVMGRKAL